MKTEVKDLESELQFLGRNARSERAGLLIRTENERSGTPRLTSPVKSTSLVWYNALLPLLPFLTCFWQRLCMKIHTHSLVPAFHICSFQYQAGSKAWTLLWILYMEPFLVPFPAKKMEHNQLTAFTLLLFHHKKSRATFSLRLFCIQEEWRNQCCLIKPGRRHSGCWRWVADEGWQKNFQVSFFF